MNKRLILRYSILLLILSMMTGIAESQTRQYSFTNNAQNEGFSVTQNDSISFRFRHALKSLKLDSVVYNGYSGHQIKGCGIQLPSESGRPNIPTICHYLAIPNGASVTVEINSITSQTIQNVDLMASPPICQETDTTPVTYEKDSIIYHTNAFYPIQTVSISDTFSIRGVKTVALSVSPYQYNPVTKELLVHHDLDVTVRFVGGNGQFGDSRLRSPYWDPILMQNFVNYDRLPVIDYEARMDNWLNTRPEGYEYLIVIPNNEDFRPYANQLKEYRIKQGILTEVKSLSEMQCSNSEQIKAYFHNAYNSWDIVPVAVCLLGDHNDNCSLGIPAECVEDLKNNRGNDPTPHYISDNRYADVANDDGLPEIVFSRLVAADTTEAKVMVSKQLEYEHDSVNMSPDYYDHPITSTCWYTPEWFQLCTEVIGGYWRKQGKHPFRINDLYHNSIPGNVWSSYINTDFIVDYFGPNGLDYIPSDPSILGGWSGGTSNNILDSVNLGSMLLFHRDHGDVDSWEKPNFSMYSIPQLMNTRKLTFVISVDCLTGRFNHLESNCLIEEFMRYTFDNRNAGAVGCIAPTRKSYSFVNDVYSWGLFDYFMPDFMPDNNYASIAEPLASYEGNWLPAFGNVAAKYFLSQNNWSGYPEYKRITYDIYTSHCDAFLRLYSVVPQTMTVTHPTNIDMQQGSCYVTAPEGATIALTVGNTILKVATATGNPQVLEFGSQDPNTVINLVVTKQDYLRYEAQITNKESFIAGPSELELPHCDNYIFDAVIPDYDMFTYHWSCSPNLRVVSTSSNICRIRPVSTGSGTINVVVMYQGEFYAQYTKNVNVTSDYTVIGTAPIIINSNTTWSSENLMLQYDAVIESDATLTITGTVSCLANTSIIVKPNGRLRIAGGHLKGICEDEQWNGIQVWGNSNKHQIIENGLYHQGYVELCDSAIIENAIIGIDVWKPDDYSSTGGIVKAENACFVNNAMAVFFHPYENKYEHPYQNGVMVVKDNVSSFNKCDFILNENYQGPESFEMHVNLFRVRGVKFTACNFLFQNNNYSSLWPMGIHAYDAGFNITGICAQNNNPYPGQVFDNSTFNGFYKAVVSLNDGSVGVRPVTVKNTDFTNNTFGIYTLKSGFTTILNSTFGIDKNNTQCTAGIIARNTSNFVIEQDTFYLIGLTPYNNYGIVIEDSKSQNLIYKNVFDGLYCANLSVGRNNTYVLPRNAVGVKANILGLEYCCNENNGNLCDFYVLGGNNIYKLGVQTNQGANNEPANNTFSAGSLFQFMNYGNYGINYYYNPNMTNGNPNYTTGVTLKQTADSIGCPSHYSNGGISYNDTLTPVLSDTQKLQRETDYYEAYTAYNALKIVYENRLNGGNTEVEIDDIRAASSSDMWALRAQLLDHSPYLTNEVLTTVADKDEVFPQSVLFEILASNPDELKNDTLISYLQNLDNPMPEYMISLLRQLANGVTERTAIESQMARYCQKYRQAAGDMIRSILNDTVIERTALMGWLGNMEELESDREIISIYLEEGDSISAFALANMLPTLYNLTGEELIEHNNYMAMLNMYQRLYKEGRDTMKLGEVERSAVEYMANNSSGLAQAMAQAIMMGVYGYHYDDCPNGVELNYVGDRGMNLNILGIDASEAMGLTINASPNPANTWVTINYTLPMGADKAQLQFTNAYGVVVATCDLSSDDGQKVIDLRSLASGVYTYTLFCGKLSQSGKLVIEK